MKRKQTKQTAAPTAGQTDRLVQQAVGPSPSLIHL